MIITIYQGFTPAEILLGSKDERFAKSYGNTVRVPAELVYRNLAEITAWANNELGEEVLCDVD